MRELKDIKWRELPNGALYPMTLNVGDLVRIDGIIYSVTEIWYSGDITLFNRKEGYKTINP